MWAVAVGDPFEGVSLYGPFLSSGDASAFTDTVACHMTWTIVEIKAPYRSASGEGLPLGLFVGETGQTPNEEALVTLWPNGEVELAHRRFPSEAWGPPVVLVSRETR